MPVIHEITDLTAPELDVYARLTQAQLRNRLEPEKGIFIAESPKVIARALDAGYQPLSLLMERRQITGPAQEVLTRCGDVPVYTADRELLAALTGEPLPAREDIAAKKQLLLRHGLALWDTLESCTITGASDASIRDVVPNDIAGLLAKAPIEAVFCNGATAYKIYTKYLEPVSGIPAVRLPSTSPANAACSPARLEELWGAALADWIVK